LKSTRSTAEPRTGGSRDSSGFRLKTSRGPAAFVSKGTGTPANPRTSNTPGTGHDDCIAVKVAGGCGSTDGNVGTASHGARREFPEEAEVQEGRGAVGDFTVTGGRFDRSRRIASRREPRDDRFEGNRKYHSRLWQAMQSSVACGVSSPAEQAREHAAKSGD
jgi:hypothetical protein